MEKGGDPKYIGTSLWRVYSKMYSAFKLEPFSFENVVSLFNGKERIATSKMLMTLRTSGWLEVVGKDPKDKRIRLYKLKDPTENLKIIVEKL